MAKMKRVVVDIEDGHDHISALPDKILSHILSFLPTEDLVRASCLSKTWKSLCFPLSILDLDFGRFFKTCSNLNHKEKKGFPDFVECMTLLYKDRHLKEFRLAIDISKFKQDRSQVDKWVSFAMTSDSATLELDFHGGNVDTTTFEIYSPWLVCPVRLQSLQVLRLKLSCLPSSDMSFSLLKTIFLTMVFCPGQSIHDLIKNCPCLEELHLIKCYLPECNRFEGRQSKLNCLVIDSCKTIYGYIHAFNFDIPSLLRFKFSGEVLAHILIVKPRNLIEVELHISKVLENIEDADEDDADKGHYEMLRELLTNMDNVNTLTLSSSCIQILNYDYNKAIEVMKSGHESHEILPPPLPNVKHLTVKMFLGLDLLSIACLLKSSPELERLCINLSYKSLDDSDISSGESDDEEESDWRSHMFSSKYLRCLKKVEIKGFEGRFVENVFIDYILANSLVLEEMVIYKAAMESRCASLKRDGKEKELKLLEANQRKAIEYLLTLRRGSSRAQVLLLFRLTPRDSFFVVSLFIGVAHND